LTTVAVKYNELKSLGVEVLAIRIDTQFTHKMWQETELSKMVEGGVPYLLLKLATWGIYFEAWP